MFTLFGIAVRNLLQARRRTALLSAAIGLVTLFLVLLLSVSKGIEKNLIDSAIATTTGHVNVGGFFKVNAGTAAPIVTDAARIRGIVEQKVPGLAEVTLRNRGWGKMISPTGSTQVGINGVDITTERSFLEKIQLAPEKDYVEGGADAVNGDPQVLTQPHQALIFASQARRLGLKVGDIITLQTETFGGRTNTLDVTVAAVAADMGLLTQWGIFVPSADVVELYQLGPDTTGVVRIVLDDIERAEQVMADLREVLAAEGYGLMEHEANPFWMKFETAAAEEWTGQKLDLTVWTDEVSFLLWVIKGFNAVTFGLVFVLVVIIAVGITNAMWNAVRERTREIGTLRAMGMQRTQVVQLILFEALALGLFATLAGGLGGALLATAVDAAELPIQVDAVKAILLSDKLNLVADPATTGVSILVLTGLTALAGLWPAARAAALPPVTAIQTVE